MPPYHVFLPYWLEYADPPCPALRLEEWQFPAQIMPVVRDVVEHAGFRVKKVEETLLYIYMFLVKMYTGKKLHKGMSSIN